MFDILNFIETKRDGKPNDPKDMEPFVSAVMAGDVKDYQVSSWLMAVYLNGLDKEELVAFTRALAASGKTVSFSKNSVLADKHSTGGVGDKTTLVLVPLVASCGLPIAKLSGRGLGFTGGTVDKLESIKGLNLHLSLEDFKRQVMDIGCAIAGHSPDLAPAEGIFYELRDVTGTVPSVPLICSSIVSKKVAGGAGVFVFDVKYGSGAFAGGADGARRLARSLVDLSKGLGYRSSALITSMEEPLGRWVGNSMEVKEALEVLKNQGPKDTAKLCIALAGEMLYQAGRASSSEEGEEIAGSALEKGKGLDKFMELVERQGGPKDLSDKPEKYLTCGKLVYELKASRDGSVSSMDVRAIGEGIKRLGGGRSRKEDKIDPGAAVEMTVKIGDSVKNGDVILRAYYNDQSLLPSAEPYLKGGIKIGEASKIPALVLERIR